MQGHKEFAVAEAHRSLRHVKMLLDAKLRLRWAQRQLAECRRTPSLRALIPAAQIVVGSGLDHLWQCQQRAGVR